MIFAYIWDQGDNRSFLFPDKDQPVGQKGRKKGPILTTEVVNKLKTLKVNVSDSYKENWNRIIEKEIDRERIKEKKS
jgi:hypothetical protein